MGSTDTYRRAMPCFNSPHSLVHSTGESYGGVFVPMLAQLIVKHNAQQQERQQQQLLGRAYPRIPPLTHPHPINLVGYMIGNAVTNDAFDGNGQVEFAYGMGLIAPPLQEALQADCQGSYWNATRGEGDRPGGEQAGRLQGGTHCLSLGWPERVKPPRLINDCFLRPYSCSGSACRQRLDEVADIIHDHLNPYSILKDCHYQNNGEIGGSGQEGGRSVGCGGGRRGRWGGYRIRLDGGRQNACRWGRRGGGGLLDAGEAGGRGEAYAYMRGRQGCVEGGTRRDVGGAGWNSLDAGEGERGGREGGICLDGEWGALQTPQACRHGPCLVGV